MGVVTDDKAKSWEALPRGSRRLEGLLQAEAKKGGKKHNLVNRQQPQIPSRVAPATQGGYPMPPNDNPGFKTTMCSKIERGEHCSYGAKCTFAHDQAELVHFCGLAVGVRAPQPAPALAAPLADFMIKPSSKGKPHVVTNVKQCTVVSTLYR